MDVRVLSTLGLTDDDLEALRATDGVESVMGAYETDAMATIKGEQLAVRIHSLPEAALASDTGDGVNAVSEDEGYLNRPVLLEGEWPRASGECVILGDVVMGTPVQVGDMVTLGEGTLDVDDVLPTRTYRVVGLVRSSYYATSSSLGTTSLGSGSIQQVLYVPESDFSDDLPYTEAFLTVAGAAAERASSEAYDARIDAAKQAIEALAPVREQARADGLRADAQAELDDARADYEREKADADAQLADAKAQLDDAAATLEESEQKLRPRAGGLRIWPGAAGRAEGGNRRTPLAGASAAGRRPGSARRAEAAARCGGRDARGRVGAVGAALGGARAGLERLACPGRRALCGARPAAGRHRRPGRADRGACAG